MSLQREAIINSDVRVNISVGLLSESTKTMFLVCHVCDMNMTPVRCENLIKAKVNGDTRAGFLSHSLLCDNGVGHINEATD